MKKIILLIILLIFPVNLAYAEKIPVRISPVQIISTHHDEVEIGDKINFEVVSDVYKGNNVFIKKGSIVYSSIDFLHPNGWLGDPAEIKFANFIVKDVNNNKIEIEYPLTINGNMLVKSESKQMWAYILTMLIRGSEIELEPDTRTLVIFINQ